MRAPGKFSAILLMFSTILFSSCSSRLSITKKRYSQGYHVSFAKQADHDKKVKGDISENDRVKKPAPITITATDHRLAETPTRVISREPLIKITDGLKPADKHSLASTQKGSSSLLLYRSIPEKPLQYRENIYSAKQKRSNSGYFPYGAFGGNIAMQLFFYILGSIVATVAAILFFLLLEALISGATAGLFFWLGPFLVVIGILAAIALAVIIIFNSD